MLIVIDSFINMHHLHFLISVKLPNLHVHMNTLYCHLPFKFIKQCIFTKLAHSYKWLIVLDSFIMINVHRLHFLSNQTELTHTYEYCLFNNHLVFTRRFKLEQQNEHVPVKITEEHCFFNNFRSSRILVIFYYINQGLVEPRVVLVVNKPIKYREEKKLYMCNKLFYNSIYSKRNAVISSLS